MVDTELGIATHVLPDPFPAEPRALNAPISQRAPTAPSTRHSFPCSLKMRCSNNATARPSYFPGCLSWPRKGLSHSSSCVVLHIITEHDLRPCCSTGDGLWSRATRSSGTTNQQKCRETTVHQLGLSTVIVLIWSISRSKLLKSTAVSGKGGSRVQHLKAEI